MLSPGIDLRPALKAGTLRMMATMPETIGAEEHLLRAIQAIEAFGPNHVVVDAISSCKRIGTKQAAFEYLMRLTNTCKERGITTIFTNQTEGFQEAHEISGIGISSVIDTVIFLRYIDVGGEINRILLVMKSRGTKHSNQYREFRITGHGLEMADVYVGEGGVLTGVARQEQEAKEKLARLLKERELELKEQEIIQKRAALQAQTVNLNAEIKAAEAELAWLRLKSEVGQKGRDTRGTMRGEDADSERLVSPATRGKRRHPRSKGGAK
jgi:circadian clock protein KaiC